MLYMDMLNANINGKMFMTMLCTIGNYKSYQLKMKTTI